MSSETFTLFPKFPLEIRRMVWAYAHEPRVIEIEWSGRAKSWVFRPQSIQRTPRLYRVNKEVRQEFLRSYKLISLNFESSGNMSRRQPREFQDFSTTPFSPRQFFNPNIDVLYLAASNYRSSGIYNQYLDQLNAEFLKEVKSIAVVFEHFVEEEFNVGPPYNFATALWACGRNDFDNPLRHLLPRLPALKELVATVGDMDTRGDQRGYAIYGREKQLRRIGLVELTELTRDQFGDEVKTRPREKLQAWMEALVRLNIGTSRSAPIICVRQVVRGGKLIAVDNNSLLSD
jgi:hypothetical protein